MNVCHYDKRMDFFYNQSKSQTEDDWTGPKLIMLFCFGAFCSLFIFISNLLVIAAVVINKRFHYPFYYLLANLAAADLFSGIAYVFLMFHTGPVSKTLTVHRWFLRQGLLDTSMTASLANLLVIAVERHISIVRMRIHSNLTKRRVTCLILLIWGVAIFMGAVPTLGWNCICDITTCSSLAPIYSRSYLTFWTVSNLVVFIIMVVVYLRIYMYVQRKTNVLSSHTTGSISRRRTPIKLMKTVMTVLGSTQSPYFMTTGVAPQPGVQCGLLCCDGAPAICALFVQLLYEPCRGGRSQNVVSVQSRHLYRPHVGAVGNARMDGAPLWPYFPATPPQADLQGRATYFEWLLGTRTDGAVLGGGQGVSSRKVEGMR